MKILQGLIQLIYGPAQNRLAKRIGCKLIFNYFPKEYLPGIVRCEMTRTWKKAGLNIIKGQNHFTVGRIEAGRSGRYDPDSITYQSWLGGYTVKLREGIGWNVEDYCKLAIADQNSWLAWYGDPEPFTSVEGWTYKNVSTIRIESGHVGTLYEGGFTAHCDMGPNTESLRFRFVTNALAALYNLSNPRLSLRAGAFVPNGAEHSYHRIDGKVYIAIFDVASNVKVILYANGIHKKGGTPDTFDLLKDKFLRTMESCEIMKN
ncbi:MAG: hypothetical protein ABL984_03130 [Pyrinomonadaceae bacterium]